MNTNPGASRAPRRPHLLARAAYRWQRWPLRYRAATAVLAALVLAAATLGAYGLALARTAQDSLTQADLLPTTTPPSASPTPGAPIVNPGQGALLPEQRQPDQDVLRAADGTEDILIVGSDDRHDGEGARADVIIVAHVSRSHQRVDLIHIPRDFYVNIPGHGYNRINDAYSVGGAPLLAQTVQNTLGVEITHAAVTDFAGFKNTVDALGGVDVYIRESSPPVKEFPPYTAGETVHMMGKEALYFARERKSLAYGDMSRGQRQMDLLAAIFKKTLTPETLANPAATMNVISSVAANVTTDRELDMRRAAQMAFDMRNTRAEDLHKVPAPWEENIVVDGQDVIAPDWAALEDLQQHMVNDDMASYAPAATPSGRTRED